MENNTSHAGRCQDSPEVRAITILLRDQVRSDKAGEACRRMSYGFRKECEMFLREVAEINPHRDVRGLAYLRLGQFLNSRLQRLELLAVQPSPSRQGTITAPASACVTVTASSRTRMSPTF
ncbi:MAG: hypothetical protein ACYC4U_17895 [Pirellulaceae bacterium]